MFSEVMALRKLADAVERLDSMQSYLKIYKSCSDAELILHNGKDLSGNTEATEAIMAVIQRRWAELCEDALIEQGNRIDALRKDLADTTKGGAR